MPLHHYGRIPRPGRLVCAVWFRRPGGCRREWSSTDVSRHKNDSYGAQGYAVVVWRLVLTPNEVRFGGHFLPYDVGNFEFSSQLGLRESDQEQGIYNLNQNVLNAGPTPAEQALIEGWYANQPGPSKVLDKTSGVPLQASAVYPRGLASSGESARGARGRQPNSWFCFCE